MNVMKMPVKELMKNETARTEACGWILMGCGLGLDAVTLIGNLSEGRGIWGAFQAGIIPILFGAWMLDRSQFMARVASAGKPATHGA